MIKCSWEEIWELKNKTISLLTLFEKSLADEYDRNDFKQNNQNTKSSFLKFYQLFS